MEHLFFPILGTQSVKVILSIYLYDTIILKQKISFISRNFTNELLFPLIPLELNNDY